MLEFYLPVSEDYTYELSGREVRGEGRQITKPRDGRSCSTK